MYSSILLTHRWSYSELLVSLVQAVSEVSIGWFEFAMPTGV